MTPSKWLPQVLTANGMNEQDLEKALQLEPGSIRELMDKKLGLTKTKPPVRSGMRC